MSGLELALIYVGGPTVLLELGGLRLLTDPTFDPAGSAFHTPTYQLRKTQSPALPPEELGRIDAVLLSHDHHYDNLDAAGRQLLNAAARVLTTEAGAERLGGNARGLAPWSTIELVAPNGRVLRVTGTPARHGPPDGDRGPVTGFALAWVDAPGRAIYVSGDTVWYEGVAAVSERLPVRIALLFLGAARIAAVGPAHLTMTAGDALQAAGAFPEATLVPVHFEGWTHFSESRADVMRAFASAGLERRLRWLEPGKPTALSMD